jgi:putative tryptophan/tyrosine transport system substrate-binding protein
MKLGMIGLIVSLAVGIVVPPPGSDAQPLAQMARVGILTPAAGPSPFLEAFRQGLRDLGYIEGHNIALEARYAGGRDDLLPDLATDLVQHAVNVIFASSDAAVRAAKQATRTIPIVMLVGGDPVGSGLITSLTRPGGNITGITGLSARLTAKRLELLKQVVPVVSRMGVLFNPDDASKALDWQQLQVTARALGVRLHPVEVRAPNDFQPAFAAMSQDRDGALITFGDAFTMRHRTQIVTLAAASRLPAIYESREFAETGGLMTYGPRLLDMFRRAASYVAKILSGAKPGDLPVEEATTFALVINLKTARALGLSIPPSLLARADEVIQ